MKFGNFQKYCFRIGCEPYWLNISRFSFEVFQICDVSSWLEGFAQRKKCFGSQKISGLGVSVTKLWWRGIPGSTPISGPWRHLVIFLGTCHFFNDFHWSIDIPQIFFDTAIFLFFRQLTWPTVYGGPFLRSILYSLPKNRENPTSPNHFLNDFYWFIDISQKKKFCQRTWPTVYGDPFLSPTWEWSPKTVKIRRRQLFF